MWLSSLVASSTTRTTKKQRMVNNNWGRLAKVWSAEHALEGPGKVSAIRRTLPLLQDGAASVPFVCRYRADVIAPLSTSEVHKLMEMLQLHDSLYSLRQKLLDTIIPTEKQHANPSLKERIECSISKSELEDLYAPFKPPSKGSLEDRIAKEHPHLKAIVEEFWQQQQQSSRSLVQKLKPREAVITLLASQISRDTVTTNALLEYVERYARIHATRATEGASMENDKKYSTYYDFSTTFPQIRDHQVLAIRRGVNQKALKLSFDIDAERTECKIRRSLLDEGKPIQNSDRLWRDAIQDAWSRLLRKRITQRLWKEKCGRAEQRSIQIFCDNLQKALLAPPPWKSSAPRPLLALDPGFQAGIKACLLDKTGQLLFRNDVEMSLITVKYLHNRDQAIQTLVGLLQILYSAQEEGEEELENNNTGNAAAKKRPSSPVVTVALGNGQGTQEARQLVREASHQCGVPIDIQLVNEAGASVWSVSDGAHREFPSQPPAAVASVSIGRRYQNPLPELVKIPPKSLGLGMYQHDLKESDLDEKLRVTSIFAVAEVGVDGNSCSLEILEKIPGLNAKLAQRIIEARPLLSRQDLLERVSGLGPKTFENCAAFIKIIGGNEPLDATLVHPEAYPLARYLIKSFRWGDRVNKALISMKNADLPQTKEGRWQKWSDTMGKAATKFNVSADRVDSVVGHLITSILNPDPRLGGSLSIVGASSSVSSATTASEGSDIVIGSVDGCSLLPSSVSTSTEALRKACPLRGIVATVRNVVDFGAFVDFGGQDNGLLHRSKLGGSTISLSSLLVGQEIGVDILSVSDNGRVAVALNGLNLDPDSLPLQGRSATKSAATGKRSYSTTTKRKTRTVSSKRQKH